MGKGKDLYYLDDDGKQRDAGLHEEMLGDETAQRADAAQAVLDAVADGMSQADAEEFFGYRDPIADSDLDGDDLEGEEVSLADWLFGKPSPLAKLKASLESAKDIDWWNKLTPEEQQQYLKVHPDSEMKPTSRSPEAAPTPEAPSEGDDGTENEDQSTPEASPGQPTAAWVRKGMTMAGNDRSQLPSHIKALKLPPGWKHLQYNEDPNADLMVIGKDAKNRDQYVYSQNFVAVNQAAKFARIREIDKKFDDMLGQTRKDQDDSDPEKAEHALVAELIFMTGIRPGSDDDTGADKKAYGATTLEARHLDVLESGGARLRFVGKKGVDLDLPVPDERLAKLLAARKQGLGPNDKLFPKVDDSSLRDYVKSLDGGDFKTKDIRTALGTRLARQAMARVKAPANAKDYKAAAREVGKVVSQVLGNTPAVALTSYIDPTLFTEWKQSSGV